MGFSRISSPFSFFENQPIGIETDLKSKYIDLDQLFELGFGQEGSGEYQFNISPDLNLNFNCDIQSMHYKRFKPQRISGNMLIKNQMAVARNVSFDGIGGKLSLNGVMDAKNNKAIEVMTAFKLNGIHIDSAFYIFEDFRQDFIKQEHLKGQAYADVDLEMVLNENLKLFPETLIANISAIIKNGELNNFERMKRLNRYSDDEGLSKPSRFCLTAPAGVDRRGFAVSASICIAISQRIWLFRSALSRQTHDDLWPTREPSDRT